jgi:AcrR family transcriptional regulator
MVDFDRLPDEKRRGILNAALVCFGKNGYKKASGADIAKGAGVAKASIFQYFGTKKELYFYLFDFACEKMMREMPAGTDDYFECLRIAAEAKLRVMAEYSGMFGFLSSVVTESDGGILPELRERAKTRLSDGIRALFADVDWGKFKPEISGEKAANIVGWVHDGYVRSAVGRKDLDTTLRESGEYMELLKSVLYKEEFLK